MDTRMSSHAQAVLRWRESLATMSDHHFFELMRMYIGEVKTPYNKQKLIEELSSFIRREDHKKAMFSLLSENDCMILAAVRHLPSASQEKLALFFSGTYTFASLYEQLMNLEERLLIYRYAGQKGDTPVFLLNPLLTADLEPYTSLENILPPCEENDNSFMSAPKDTKTDPQTIGAVISYISQHTDIFKADGSIKKKVMTAASELFPRDPDGCVFTAAAAGMKNLGLIQRTGELYRVDRKKCALFAQLSHDQQCAYLAAAVHHFFPRETMYRRASLLLKTVSSIPPSGYTKKVLARSLLLIQEQMAFEEHGPGARTGRFASILERSRSELPSQLPESAHQSVSVSMNTGTAENLIESAAVLGLIAYDEEAGKDGVYTSACTVSGEDIISAVPEKSLLRIDAGFSLSVMPDMTLSQLLPLLPFCRLVQCDRVSRYEISRSSCMSSFDEGYTPEKIFEVLKKYTPFELPQSLVISVEEWFHNYSAASLYQGFILQVSAEKQIAVENNKVLSPHIVKTIAPGVYLLDFKTQEEAAAEIARSSLDFIGAVKSFEKEEQKMRFTPLAGALPETRSEKQKASVSEQDQKEHTQYLIEKIEKSSFTREQKEGLISRINRRIIVDEVQLRPDSVKAERTEASGMDFLGKVHVIEAAYATGCMAELLYDDTAAENGVRVILGVPAGFEKMSGDTVVKIRTEPDHEIVSCSIGSAKSVKRIRGPIFREIR